MSEEPQIKGFCPECGEEIILPHDAAWPDRCLHCGAAPFVLVSDRPKRWPDDFRGFGIHVKW